MGILYDFEKYLIKEGKREKTITSYIGALKLINQIAEKINLPKIEDWSTVNMKIFTDQIKNDQAFVDRNTKGNNMYSASLNHYNTFIEEQNSRTGSLENQFQRWITNYNTYSNNAKQACLKAIKRVDEICMENHLGSIYSWTQENWDLNKTQLIQFQEMVANSKRVTPPGSGWYSASVTKYK